MSTPTVGQPAPDFETTDDSGNPVKLADFKGKQPVALVFFPKDDTPGCTKEMCNLRDNQSALDEAGVKAFGVSFEDQAAHTAFRQKYGLSTPILMDTERKLGEAYGSTMIYEGQVYPARKTFVIGTDGNLKAAIEKVDVENHAQQILDALKA